MEILDPGGYYENTFGVIIGEASHVHNAWLVVCEKDGSTQVFDKPKVRMFNRITLKEGMRVQIMGLTQATAHVYNNTEGTVVRFDKKLNKWLILCDVDNAVNAL